MNVLRLSEIKQKCYLFNSCALEVEEFAVTNDVNNAIHEDFVCFVVRCVGNHFLNALRHCLDLYLGVGNNRLVVRAELSVEEHDIGRRNKLGFVEGEGIDIVKQSGYSRLRSSQQLQRHPIRFLHLG